MNVSSILEKMKNKEKLLYGEIEYIVNGYVTKTVSDEDMTKFLMQIYNEGFSSEETNYLTDIMIKSGEEIDLSEIKYPTIDKHSSGGVGDKVTLIISPIVASLGVAVPKMSGRGLGLTGGTADKLESIVGYDLELSKADFIKQLNEIQVAVISQSENIAIADKKIYALRDEIGAVDSIPLIASSIMSKKIACGTKNIVIDLKVGKGAFMKTEKEAVSLSNQMIEIGKYYNRNVICLLSNMDVPLGRSIGNSLEVKETIEFFEGIYEKRLYDLVIEICSLMYSVSVNVDMNSARKSVLEVLENGKAKEKFYEWIKYQNGDIKNLKDKSEVLEIYSDETGFINNVDAEEIAKLVYDLGSGRQRKEDEIDYASGVWLDKTIGEEVQKGELLGRIYYNKKTDNMENKFKSAFSINKTKENVNNIIIKIIK